MSATSSYPDLFEASIADLNAGLSSGLFNSVDLAKAYLARIAEVDRALHSVLETNPHVLEQAAVLDAERKEKGPRGPLHGIPILIKDNIATDPADGMQTTAGSYALIGALPPRPAHTIHLLSSAGALILGKASLSEWANFRGEVPSGWCARSGQCYNSYVRGGDPGGSSSGSAVAAAVGLAAACVGTETDGSICGPSRRCGVVGVKPTVGLTSRAGVIPVSFTQDSVGPIARCVADAALLLNAMAGPDPRDKYTDAQPKPTPDHTAHLTPDALRGARIGIPRGLMPPADELETPLSVFEEALSVLTNLGAEIVEDVRMPSVEELGHGKRWGLLPSEQRVIETEFRPGLEKYLTELTEVPSGVRTLEDVIEFNKSHADQELILPHYADQSRFIACVDLKMDEEYEQAVEESYRLGRKDGIDHALKTYNLDALVLPSDANSTTVPAISGYPCLTIPLGFAPAESPTTHIGPLVDRAPGLPLGLTFFSTAWTETKLLGYAYAFEQATNARVNGKVWEGAKPTMGLGDVVEK